MLPSSSSRPVAELRPARLYPLPILILRGDIDLGCVEVVYRTGAVWVGACRAALGDRPDAGHGPAAIVDVTELHFIDALGVNALVTLHATLADSGIVLRIAHPTAQLRRISAICGLDDILGLRTSRPAVHFAYRATA